MIQHVRPFSVRQMKKTEVQDVKCRGANHCYDQTTNEYTSKVMRWTWIGHVPCMDNSDPTIGTWAPERSEIQQLGRPRETRRRAME